MSKDYLYVLNSKFLEMLSELISFADFEAADLADHDSVITLEVF